MKKLISLILSIAFIFSLIPPNGVFALSSLEADNSSSIKVLEDLNLLPDNFKESSKMTRENFVVFLIKAMGLSNVSNNKPLPFNDVSQDMASYNALSLAFDLGIINGNGQGFLPKNTVSLYQAVKMTISALGYGQLAEAKGGYPAGYLQIAYSLDLLDGLSKETDETVKGSDAACLLYNALNSSVMQVAEIGNGSVSYSDSTGKTMLEVYHSIIPFEGQLRGTKACVISGNYDLSENQVIIDNTTYKTNGASFDSLVGYTVRAYYSKNKSKIVAMEKSQNANKSIVLSAEDISGFSNGYLTYIENEKEKKIALGVDCDIAYNGRPASVVNAALFNLDDGDVTLIDSNGDGSYDAVIISDFVNYVVSAVAADEKIIYDLYDSAKVLTVGETDEIFVDDFGNTMYFEELKKYDVLSVWKSTDGKNIRIKFSNKEIRGSITEKNTTSGSVIIDGKEFEFAKNFSVTGSSLELGSTGIFALDASGKIAAFNPSEGNWEYAYLISTATGSSPLEQAFMIRVFTIDGNIIILDCDLEKLLIDGYSKTADEAKAYFSKSQLIRYETNSEGKVVMIDTPSSGTGDDDLLQLTHTAYDANYEALSTDTMLRWSSGAMLWSGKIPVASDVKVINVPHPGSVADDDEYYLSYVSAFKTATYYDFESYKTGNDSFISDILIRYIPSGNTNPIKEKTPISVIDEVKYALNSEGDSTVKLCAYYNGSTYREYFFDDEEIYNSIVDSSGQPHTLKKGDIVRLEINENSGAIKKIELVYNRVKDELTNGASVSGTHFASERFVKGKVYEKEDNFISITQENMASGIELDPTKKEVHVLFPNQILIYDSSVRGGEVRPASFSDVRDFKNFGAICSDVVIFTVDGGDTSIVVIYK